MTRVIAIANQKGGVGKTTTTINVASGLANMGKRVLIVDMDPQGNVASGFGREPESLTNTMYQVLMEDMPISDIMTEVEPNLFLAPSNIDLFSADVRLLQAHGKEIRLKRALAALGDEFDYVLIDCPPSINQLTTNAFTAAREIIVPVQLQFYALKGVQLLEDAVVEIRKWSNEGLVIGGIVATFYHPSKKLSKQVLEEVKSYFGEKVYESVIPDATRVAEAPAYGEAIHSYDPGSKASEAYKALCREIVAQEGRRE